MDLLIIALIVLAVISLGGWGYGTYGYRSAPGTTTEVVTAPAWSTPLGLVGVIVVVGLMLMLLTGWRPFVVAI